MTLHALSISSNIDARLSMKAFKCRQKQQQQQKKDCLKHAYISLNHKILAPTCLGLMVFTVS